jgi:alkylresorcinol/alkylpyrone synthase
MTTLAGIGTGLPPHYYRQEELISAFKEYWGRTHHNLRRVEQLHKAVRVGGRHLALPLDQYPDLTFGKANKAFARVAVDVAAEALTAALDAAKLTPASLDAIFFTTVTGVATPSIDARLVNRLGLRTDIRRVPMFGLGCVAGAAGIARMHDFLRGRPDGAAALVSVELCSLTLQRTDLTIPNLIASGLFGDGSGAVVATGSARPDISPAAGPTVVDTRSRFYPDTEDVMGWEVEDTGLRIVLSPAVPQMVLDYLRDDVDGFLAEHGLTRSDIASWVCHPGGPKVLSAFQTALELPREALQLTWDSLGEVGNLSSSSVLFVLRDTLAKRPPPVGSYGMMLAMGPGFCSELVLLRW